MTAGVVDPSAPVVRCERVVKIHRTRDTEVIALSGVDLVVEPGELVGIVGPSGSGKSSLLALLAGLTSPSAGRVEVLGQDIGRLSERQRLALRAEGLGVMMQSPDRNLLPYGRVLDNLEFAQRRPGTSRRERHDRAVDLLDVFGLGAKARRPVRALSGGEQQRLALAVSLADRPTLLLVDEPTNQLDAANRDVVAQLLHDARDNFGVSVLAVTHDAELGAAMDRSLAMRDGRLGTERRAGQTAAVVAPDGSVQLPDEVSELYPPGSRVRFVRRPDHLELHPFGSGGSP